MSDAVTVVVNDQPVKVEVLTSSINITAPPAFSVEITEAGPPGPPGPPGAAGAQYSTDLPAVTAGVPVTVTHDLDTTDVGVTVTRNGSPVEVDWRATSLATVSLTFSGTGIPTGAGAFRVTVRGGAQAAPLPEVYVSPGEPVVPIPQAFIWVDADEISG